MTTTVRLGPNGYVVRGLRPENLSHFKLCRQSFRIKMTASKSVPGSLGHGVLRCIIHIDGDSIRGRLAN